MMTNAQAALMAAATAHSVRNVLTGPGGGEATIRGTASQFLEWLDANTPEPERLSFAVTPQPVESHHYYGPGLGDPGDRTAGDL